MTGGDDGAGRFDALQQRAVDAWQADDLEAARLGFLQALSLAQELKDIAGQALCWHRLGAVALRKGDFGAAVEPFENALALYRELQDGPGYAATLHQLGTISLQRRDYEEARRLSRAALDVQHQVGDAKGEARSLYQIAASFMEEDNVAEAAEGFSHAIKVMNEVDDVTGLSLTLQNLSVMAERNGKAEASFRFLAAAAALQAESGQAGAEFDIAQLREQATKAGIEVDGLDTVLKSAADAFARDDGAALIAEAFGPPEASESAGQAQASEKRS
ncbi:MAG: tetratricopeptide repeat protein [Kiloniellales bacterium]|nr:tetratricopeptide repeat protein [Kiloniellales bacterium]